MAQPNPPPPHEPSDGCAWNSLLAAAGLDYFANAIRAIQDLKGGDDGENRGLCNEGTILRCMRSVHEANTDDRLCDCPVCYAYRQTLRFIGSKNLQHMDQTRRVAFHDWTINALRNRCSMAERFATAFAETSTAVRQFCKAVKDLEGAYLTPGLQPDALESAIRDCEEAGRVASNAIERLDETVSKGLSDLDKAQLLEERKNRHKVLPPSGLCCNLIPVEVWPTLLREMEDWDTGIDGYQRWLFILAFYFSLFSILYPYNPDCLFYLGFFLFYLHSSSAGHSLGDKELINSNPSDDVGSGCKELR